MDSELEANTRLSHYRIVSKIGAGGMGEVWLAEDTRLGRKVALKLLPAEFTEDSERVRRFTQEAKAASALNHPNIISVYDIGECDIGRFIVMEFVAGSTLRSVIAKDNSIETLFTLGAQMAKALSTAHAAGITHRDIKPDNIMVRDDGYVKMLDFGLARLLPTSSSDPEAMTLAQQTTPGTVMGTLAYMSPEQASGQTAGSPSDVFALGIVLYELATGSHPFKSETMVGYLHAITSQVPPSITSIKSHLPAALDDLILRMLEKDARQRPTASEVAQALQEIEKYGSSNTLPLRIVADKPKVSGAEEGFWIEVLPFKTTAANQELHTLAEGLSEEIVTGLSRFAYLRVIARSSSLRQASLTTSSGQQQNARYIIEGSLRHAGSTLRVSTQLVDTSTGTHLWAETYDRPYRSENIFALQDELVPRIVSTVADQHGVLIHSMAEVMRNKSKDQFTPYEAVLSVFGFHERMTPQEHASLREILERVVREHPDQGNCWAMLETLYADEHMFGFNVLPDSLGRALNAAQRAVELAPTSNLASQALAQAYFFRRELNAFRPVAERTIALNPMDTATVAVMGLFIACSGDWEKGCAIAESAMALNPIFPGWYRCAHLFDAYRRFDYEAALDVVGRINIPGYYWTLLMSAATLGQLGQTDRAKKSLNELLTNRPDFLTSARDDLNKWFEADLVEHLMDGLRKAGLETSDEEPASTSSQASNETRADEGFWVAVLPFKATGTNAELSTLAEGLSDEIVTGLNRFSYLRVIARSSTLRYSSQTSDVRSVGKALGARYVMEGNVRQAGPVIRVTVQLVDASTGAHLWAETYDRPFKPEEIFALQDDLVPRIVSTVADQHGVLPHSMSEAVRAQDPDQLTAYETLLRGFRYYEGVSAGEHSALRAAFERALELTPGSADCWAMLSIMYCDEHKFGFNQLPDSLGRALNAAQRAVEISPTNPFAYEALAQALFFRKEFDSFRNAAERAIALNPMDGATNAFMGILIAFTGDWDYGCTVAERATQLNPHHPGWYWNAAFYNAYRRRDYEGALKITLEFNMPGLFYHHVNRAAVYGQLGDREAARKALGELLALKPDFASTARDELGKWLRPELVDHVIEGLRKAGLEIGEGEASPITSSTPAVSSLSRADEGFWIAVLPFKFTGSNTEVATLADGLSEEIVTGLSRFSYLRVISRSSTLRYANGTDDIRTVGKTLGARYVMEGSLRVAGSSLRISVQLIDAGTGAHLWAETYERQFRAEEVFVLQDDLVPRIVSTIADVNGVLPRSMCDVVCNKNPDELSPYEAVLRSFRYFDRVTAEELAAARSGLEIAVQKAPTNADAWAMLALLFVQDYGQGFNLHPDALNSGAMAAQRAVEAGPSNHLAHFSLAQARFFQKDLQGFRNAAERAVALNPMDANSLAFMGEILTYVGDSERGLALATRAKEINPNHPGWFWYADFFHAYRQGDYRGALSLILKANLPGHWGMHAGIAAAAGQLGDHETAGKAIRDLLKLRPDYGATVHNTLAKWFDPQFCEQLLDGLRKAGLEIAGEAESPN
jgi:TolB-like protein